MIFDADIDQIITGKYQLPKFTLHYTTLAESCSWVDKLIISTKRNTLENLRSLNTERIQGLQIDVERNQKKLNLLKEHLEACEDDDLRADFVRENAFLQKHVQQKKEYILEKKYASDEKLLSDNENELALLLTQRAHKEKEYTKAIERFISDCIKFDSIQDIYRDRIIELSKSGKKLDYVPF